MKSKMIDVLERASQGSLFQIAIGMEGFEDALEAYQRGWVCVSDAGVLWQEERITHLFIIGLSPEGYEKLDQLRRAETEKRLLYRIVKTLKMVFKWFFGSAERVLLTLLGSDMVLRWLVFFFKD